MMRLNCILSGLFFCLGLLCQPTVAGSFRGEAACPDTARSRYAGAINHVCRKAKVGDPKAQYEMGLVLLHGVTGVPARPHDAAAWFMKAAEQGSDESRYQLAQYYLAWEEAKKNDACRLLDTAAGNGYVYAMIVLSGLYGRGGCSTDPELADKWHERALATGNFYAKRVPPPGFWEQVPKLSHRAEAGDALAQYLLARQHDRGIRLERDNDLAEFWYKRAAAQGFVPAMVKLGVFYLKHYGESPAHVDEAVELFEAAARAGDAEGQYEMAMLHLRGKGVTADLHTAAQLLKASAAQGFASGQLALGALYRRGDGVEQDSCQARNWFRESSRRLRMGVQEMLQVTNQGGGDVCIEMGK